MNESTTTNTPTDAPVKPKRRKWRRRIIFLCIFFVLGLLLLVGLLPSILSSGPGTRYIVNTANAYIPGTLEIDELSIGWFSGQHVGGLSLTGTEGERVARVGDLKLPATSLFGLIKSYQQLGEIVGKDIELNIVQYEDGSTNLARALSASEQSPRESQKPKKPKSSQATAFNTNVQLENIRVSYLAPGVEAIEIDSPKIIAKLNKANELDVDIDASLAQGELKGRLQAHGGIKDIHAAQPTVELQAVLEALPVAAVDTLLGYEGKLVELLGPRLDSELTLAGTTVDALAGITAKSERLNLKLPLVATDAEVRQNGESNISLILTPSAYQAWLAAYDGGTLAQPITLTIDLTALRIPMAEGRPDFAQLAADLKWSLDAAVIALPAVGEIQLGRAEGSAKIDRVKDLASISMHAPLAINNQAGQIDLAASVSGLKQGAVKVFEARATDLAVALIDKVAALEGKALAALGDRASVNLKGSYPGDLDVSLESPRASLVAAWRITDEAISLRSPAKLRLDTTPQAFAVLAGEGGGQLVQPTTLNVDIHEVFLPRTADGIDIKGLRLGGTFDAKPIMMQVPDVGLMQLESLAGSLQNDQAVDTLAFKAKSNVMVNDKPGELDVVATLGGISAGEGYDLDVKMTMPTPIIDQLGGLDGDVAALVGPAATLTAVGRYPGALRIKLAGETLDFDAPAHVNDDLLVTLTGDVNAELHLREELAQQKLGKMHPLLADAVASEKPIRILIRKDGFELPLKEFAFQNVKAKGELNLGTLRMSRRGWMFQGIGAVAQMVGLKQKREAETYLATFTPADFVVTNGRVRTDEIWLTSSDMAVGFRGRADLTNNQLDFTTGFMGVSVISQFPSLHKYLPTDGIIDVPLGGNLNKPSLDVKTFALSLASAVAKAKGDDKLTGYLDLGGKFLGSLGKQDAKPASKWSPPQSAIELAASAVIVEEEIKPTEQAQPEASEKKTLTPELIERRRERRARQQQQDKAQ